VIHPWVDTHGHLFLIDDDPAAVLERAAASGVQWVMCPGVDVSTSEESEALAVAHPDSVLWSAGLHPHDAGQWASVRDRIGELAARADAIGECGLDYYRNLASREDQTLAFGEQLALASDLDKPIIIHCRDAFADVYDALAAVDLGERAVLHCWTGGSRWTKRFRDLGVVFSFAGPLTYPTAESLRIAARFAPRDRTMVETDAPYLTPQPRRSEPNEPAHVVMTGATLAEVWEMPVADVADLTSATARRVFGGPHA
jgi:TatD DNase family protein